MSNSKYKFSPRANLTLGIITMLILVVGFGGWSVMAKISGAVIAPGKIEVDRNRQVVQHPDGGVVSEILINKGETVHAGQTLIRLDATAEQSELSIVEGQLFEMAVRRSRLAAERDGLDTIEYPKDIVATASAQPDFAELLEGQTRLFNARRTSAKTKQDQLEKQSQQTGKQIEGIIAQFDALNEQFRLVAEELNDQKSLLERGLTQASKVSTLERTQAQIQGQIGELSAKQAEAEVRLTEIALAIDAITSTRREDAITQLRDQQFRFLELQERQRALKEKLSRMDIVAPVSGIVYGLTVMTPRSVVRPAEPLMYIIPQDRPLVIAASIEPIHIDKLHVGQNVMMRFSALDQRTTPELYGQVKLVSADAFEDDATKMSYYRAEITLNPGETDKLPQGVALIPGMPVETFIKTAERSPMAYFVKPLSDYFAKAFREG